MSFDKSCESKKPTTYLCAKVNFQDSSQRHNFRILEKTQLRVTEIDIPSLH